TRILIPLNLVDLRTLAFMLVIAEVVQFTEMVVRKTSPALYRLLGIFLPLNTTNCPELGVELLNINLGHNFLQTALYA
ncbi:Rnf-Nqr domain containing protein, partial [Klebsiella pneumoniae]|uniref:Rnf-Nqr domain containing protein n=1 Tax=Klebsiella pneumoniae TaxID=573 RepID=UPI00272FF4AB